MKIFVILTAIFIQNCLLFSQISRNVPPGIHGAPTATANPYEVFIEKQKYEEYIANVHLNIRVNEDSRNIKCCLCGYDTMTKKNGKYPLSN